MQAGQCFADFVLQGKLGHGGMGEVFLATDRQLDRQVAIKVIGQSLIGDQETIQRFLREARAASAVNHPNVVTIFSLGTHNGTPFICMEYVSGGTLKDLIRQGPMPIRQALEIARAVADALVCAHELEIVHRDIKPTNILLTQAGVPKLTDFGLVKILRETSIHPSGHVGTLAYMSPEQVRGQTVDVRTDIFSLGIVLYEMLVGTRPFSGSSEASVMYAILQSDPPRPQTLRAEIPWGVQEILRRSLSKDLGQRYATMIEMRDDLDRLLDTLEQTESSGLSTVARVQQRTVRLLLPLALLAAAAAAGSLVFTAWRWRLAWPGWSVAGAAGLSLALACLALVVAYERRVWSWGTSHRTLWPARAAGIALGVILAGGLLARVPDGLQGARVRSLLIGKFENLTGDPKVDWAAGGLPSLLEAVLAQNPFRVVHHKRLMASAHRLGFDPEKLTPDQLEQTARELGTDAVVDGSILSLAGEIEITFSVTDVRSGDVLLGDRVRLRSLDFEIGGAIDRIGLRIRDQLAPASGVGNVRSPGLAQSLTANIAAMRAYLRGRAAQDQNRFDEAAIEFREATRLDPGFAMAYAQLGRTASSADESRTALEQAIQYKFKLSERDRLSIDAAHAEMFEGPEKTLAAYRAQIRRFPESETGYVGVAHYARYVGDFTAALAAARKAIEVAPETADEHRSLLIGPLMQLGRWDDAGAEAQRLVEARPGDGWALASLAAVHDHRGDYSRAVECLERAEAVNPGGVLRDLAALYLRLGRIDEARRNLMAAIDRQPVPWQRCALLADLAELERLFGTPAAAAAQIQRGLDDCAPPFNALWVKVQAAHDRGDLAEARAGAAEMRTGLEVEAHWVLRATQARRLDHAEALVAELEGEVDEASRRLVQAIDQEFPVSRPFLQVALAAVLRRAGRLPAALEVVDEGLRSAPHDIPLLMERYRLLRAAGRTEDCQVAGEQLLEIWQDADPDFTWRTEVAAGLEAAAAVYPAMDPTSGP